MSMFRRLFGLVLVHICLFASLFFDNPYGVLGSACSHLHCSTTPTPSHLVVLPTKLRQMERNHLAFFCLRCDLNPDIQSFHPREQSILDILIAISLLQLSSRYVPQVSHVCWFYEAPPCPDASSMFR